MNFIFEATVNGLEAFLILEFLTRYLDFQADRPLRYVGFVIFWMLSTASITYFSWNDIFEIYSSLAQILINILFCFLFLRGRKETKIFLSAFTMMGIALLGSFTTYAVACICNEDILVIFTEFTLIRLIVIILSKILFYQITRIVLLIKENSRLSRQDIFPLVVVPVISICVIAILTRVAIIYPASQQPIFWAVLLITLLNLSTYYLFVRLGRSNKVKYDYELLTMQYECAKQSAKDLQNMYDNIRSIRHDMTNHLLCIANLLENNQEGLNNARDYVQGLLNQQQHTYRKFIFSGNDALDAILNAKQTIAYQNGINLDIIIADSLSFMAPEDICVLFGNLLDNAISASQKTNDKQIQLNIQPQDTYVSIVLSNTIDHSILANNPSLKTTQLKKDGHGYGIKNVKKVVQHYNGLIRFYEEKNRFVSDILLLTIPILT